MRLSCQYEHKSLMLYELVDAVGVHMKQRSKTEAPVCKLEVKIWVSSEGKNILSRSPY